MSDVTFGDWIKGHRVRRGLSQGRLSEITGVSRTHINKIENGAIGLPEKDTRARFHAVFGTTEAELEALGIVPRYDEWGRVIASPFDESADGLPVRQVNDGAARYDNSPLTAAELEELKDAMFHGFDELEPADLREVIAVMRRRRTREGRTG